MFVTNTQFDVRKYVVAVFLAKLVVTRFMNGGSLLIRVLMIHKIHLA